MIPNKVTLIVTDVDIKTLATLLCGLGQIALTVTKHECGGQEVVYLSGLSEHNIDADETRREHTFETMLNRNGVGLVKASVKLTSINLGLFSGTIVYQEPGDLLSE